MVSSWSIGTAKRGNLQNTNNTPGPGQYNYDKKQRKIPPSWKIGSENRQAFKPDKNPGPGNYQLRPQTSTGAKYSIATKAGPKNEALYVPGPGAYNPRPSSAYQRPPQYSMGSKYDNDYNYNNQRVGPGSYQLKGTLDKPAPKIGSGQRGNLYNTSGGPGPGQYQINRPSTAQKAKIGTSQRDELYKAGDLGVGPGTYEIKSQFDQSKGVTMTSKRVYGDQTEASLVPGPGSYNPNKQQRKTAPSFKMGTSERGTLGTGDRRTPGPGNYDYQSSFGNTKIKFGTDVRKPLNGNQDTPGPGMYEYNSKIVEGPKFSIKGATKVDPVTREKIMNPGPGQYSAIEGIGKPRPTSAKIGTSQRPDFLKARDAPGPGRYDYEPKQKSGPSFGFGTSKRPGIKKSDDPGPGNYNLPTSFADVPNYSKAGINTRK